MNKRTNARFFAVTAAIFAFFAMDATAATYADIINLAEYPEGFASAGQPLPEHYQAIANEGFQRVIYLAYADQPETDIANDRAAHAAGLDYVQIAVRWDSPRPSDFATFAAILNAADDKAFVHCQLNYRASAFSFLYRVIYQGVTVADAKPALDAVWRPNDTWLRFMRTTLDQHGFAIDCASCDWTVASAAD
ncbi:MAG: protein tyrosine phosphatase family protein [Pseudomonadota bacterium]